MSRTGVDGTGSAFCIDPFALIFSLPCKEVRVKPPRSTIRASHMITVLRTIKHDQRELWVVCRKSTPVVCLPVSTCDRNNVFSRALQKINRYFILLPFPFILPREALQKSRHFIRSFTKFLFYFDFSRCGLSSYERPRNMFVPYGVDNCTNDHYILFRLANG